jgi:hypothetical protein
MTKNIGLFELDIMYADDINLFNAYINNKESYRTYFRGFQSNLSMDLCEDITLRKQCLTESLLSACIAL